jgi:hypothetical protein
VIVPPFDRLIISWLHRIDGPTSGRFLTMVRAGQFG